MQRLQMIPTEFPFPQSSFKAATCQLANQELQDTVELRKAVLFREFKDVLNDKLPEEPMKGPPMTIEFKENIKINPKCVTTTKEVPYHFEREADTLVEKLLEDGVIKRVSVDEVSDWISPAFFVQKKGAKLVSVL